MGRKTTVWILQGTNKQAVSRVRYFGPFLKWTRDDTQTNEPTAKKLMTIHKVLHLRDNIDFIVQKKERKRK